MSRIDRRRFPVCFLPALGCGFLALAGLSACGDGDDPPTTPTPGPDDGTGTGTGAGTGAGTGYAGTGTGTGTTPESPLDAGIDEALAAGSGAPVAAPREILPLSATEAANFEQGVQAFESRGDDAAAKAAFEAVLASNATAYRAAYNLGYLAERRGDTREAILSFQRALDIKPDYPNALRALFRLLDRAGRSSEALSQVQSRANAFPDNSELQEILAEAYIAANRADEGIVIARRMLLTDANSIEAFQILLRASIQQNRTALTQELLTRIAENLEPTVPFDSCSGGGSAETRSACRLWAYCRFTYGRIAAEQGRKFEAQQYYQNAIDADPTFVEARVLVAGYQLDGGQLGPAIENLEAARRIAPTWLPVLVGLGNAYRGRGDYAGAVTVLREAERLYPSAPEVPIALGLVYYDARTLSFEGLDRARADQAALDQFRRAQGLVGGADDADLAA
ncbi:MAG: tetratricopeptide repeat protein, partial [Deltaproteobacteria bacterium]|nr:tetratricopeptide repeat protein [Deltaproteobacteria bacterium]